MLNRSKENKKENMQKMLTDDVDTIPSIDIVSNICDYFYQKQRKSISLQ